MGLLDWKGKRNRENGYLERSVEGWLAREKRGRKEGRTVGVWMGEGRRK